MALADLSDVTTHLPTDKFPNLTSGDISGQLASAERVIKGWLVGIYDPATLASWVNPGATPELIREVAAKMTAALKYRTPAASELDSEDSKFAQRLYNEAMETLRGIRDGSISLIDIGAGAVVSPSGSLSADSFYPNDAAPVPVFRMDLSF